jgi:hypothetical protein
MAFVKDKTGSAQTAANASATVVAAFADRFNSIDEAVVAFNSLREQLFADLSAVVDADNAAFAAADNGSTPKAKSNGASRSAKTGGGSKGGGKAPALKDALSLDLSWGAFKGETLETILNLSVDECFDDYGYGDGEKSGRDYISWLAGSNNNNDFVGTRARVIADAEGISYE